MTASNPWAAAQAPDVVDDWASYRAGLGDLASALAQAEDEIGQRDQERDQQLAAARERVAGAESDRDELAAGLPALEELARTVLEQVDVQPQGAGSTDLVAQVEDAGSIRFVMTEIRSGLTDTSAALAVARGQAASRRTRLVTVAVVVVATILTWVVLSAVGANVFATLGATITVCLAGVLARRRGLVPTAVVAGIGLIIVLVMWLTLDAILATILLPAAGLTGVVVLARTGRRKNR
ncbi:hypothetical protein GCM10027063_36800 [Promicromonospora xylanilytica]